jgi:hypothetical protein
MPQFIDLIAANDPDGHPAPNGDKISLHINPEHITALREEAGVVDLLHLIGWGKAYAKEEVEIGCQSLCGLTLQGNRTVWVFHDLNAVLNAIEVLAKNPEMRSVQL